MTFAKEKWCRNYLKMRYIHKNYVTYSRLLKYLPSRTLLELFTPSFITKCPHALIISILVTIPRCSSTEIPMASKHLHLKTHFIIIATA